MPNHHALEPPVSKADPADEHELIQCGWLALPIHCTQSDETNENMLQIKNAAILGAMETDWRHNSFKIMRRIYSEQRLCLRLRTKARQRRMVRLAICFHCLSQTRCHPSFWCAPVRALDTGAASIIIIIIIIIIITTIIIIIIMINAPCWSLRGEGASGHQTF